MADTLSNAVSGLLSFQRALTTTSHNIANVATEGYSKQRVSIGTNTPDFIGNSFVGGGVNILSVTRAYDQFLTTEVRDNISSYNKSNLTYELAGFVDDVLADPQGGISPILHDFFAAVNDVADDPTSTTSRNNLINVANTLADRFHNIDQRFDQVEVNTKNDIQSSVDEVNDLVAGIAAANEGLNRIGPDATSTRQSADLLDKRNQLMVELAEKIDISVINEDLSSLTIFIGNGQTILAGSEAFELTTVPNITDPSSESIVYNGLSGSFDISDSLKSGGELGALLTFRDEVLTDARNDLGRVAIALADRFNEQHTEGFDLNNNQGTAFFSFDSPAVLNNANNTGTATITTDIVDVSVLTRFDYTLTFDGAAWTVVSESGSSSAAIADLSPADTVLTFEGIELTIDGASVPAAGDSFKVRPTVNGSSSLNVIISDPLLIAAAAAIRTNTSLSNLGSAEISQGVVTDGSDANLLNTVTFTFEDPATTFVASADVVVGGSTFLAGASVAYSNNMTVAANGWEVQLSGIPAADDVVTVEANTNGQGDNRNALGLAQLQTLATMDGGFSNFQQAYSSLVGRVGTVAAAAETQRDSQFSLLIQAQDRKEGLTGVNLDEEAADLVKYQQAYQASSQIISTVQTMFDALLNATR